MPLFTSEQCLSLAVLSPQAVAVHDKAAWLAIFADDSRIEDPVGSAPHIQATGSGYSGLEGPLGRFYETFIAPNDIQFHVDQDIVCGLHVMRDLTIEIAMSEEVTVRVPMHLLYELTVENGLLKVQRLAAHWELWPMLKQQIAVGLPFLKVGAASGARMMRHLGLGGTLGFSRAARGVGEQGTAQAQRFLSHFNRGDAQGAAALFSDPSANIDFPYGAVPLSIADAVAKGGKLHFSKVLSSGTVVSTTVRYSAADAELEGVALFHVDRQSGLIEVARFYW